MIRDETAELLATWGNGLLAVTEDGRTQEIPSQPVRGLVPDGAAVRSLLSAGIHCAGVHQAVNGATFDMSEFELSCCTLLETPST